MKNITKKFSAIALACTLLVTGNTIAQKTNYETKSHAATSTCTHYNWRRYASYSDWRFYMATGLFSYYQVRDKNIKCAGCTQTVQTVQEFRFVTIFD
jgi:hypothetical protein